MALVTHAGIVMLTTSNILGHDYDFVIPEMFLSGTQEVGHPGLPRSRLGPATGLA